MEAIDFLIYEPLNLNAMHKFYFYTLLLCLLSTYSCSDDAGDSPTIEKSASPGYSKDNTGNTVPLKPANPANPYDFAGALHNSILEDYLPVEDPKATVLQIIDRLDAFAKTHADFTGIADCNYTKPTALRLSYIVSNPLTGPDEILNAAGLSPSARTSLSGYLNTASQLNRDDIAFSNIYTFSTAFEKSVLENSAYTAAEKKTILTAAAITRYGSWFRDKHRRVPRDRDLDLLITTLLAGIEGNGESTASAVLWSVSASAVSNL